MGAVLARLRTDLRARWASTLVLVLLIGIGGGAVLTSAAGARRTASSYPRMLEEANAGDVLVNPADGNTDFDAIEALPQVVAAGRGTGAFVVPRLPSGEPDFEAFNYLPVSSDGRLGYSIERPVNLQGRMPDPERAEEVFLSTPLAKDMGVDVGDTIPMVALADEATPPEAVDFEVVGVGLFSRDALQEDADATNFLSAPALIFSPAWEQSHPPNLVEGFRASFVQVEPGSLESFLTDAQTTVGDEQLYLQTLPETTSKAQRALRPYVVALAVFALVSGLAILLVVGQALTRHLLLDAHQAPTLSALGMTRGQLVGTAVARAAVVGVAGAAIAGALAVALSPLMPIGPAGELEPQPGVDVDGAV
ncbi:MAG: hypothetical protein M3R01_11205, partial [Actinomycetota bacterium]|nr:hypothetical protein [Actinomycetota bacterium]